MNIQIVPNTADRFWSVIATNHNNDFAVVFSGSYSQCQYAVGRFIKKVRNTMNWQKATMDNLPGEEEMVLIYDETGVSFGYWKRVIYTRANWVNWWRISRHGSPVPTSSVTHWLRIEEPIRYYIQCLDNLIRSYQLKETRN